MNSSIVYDTPLEEDITVFPTSLAQQRIWLLDQLESKSTICNIVSHIRLKVPLNREVFKQSLDAIMQRHDVLRTAITVVEGQLIQTITPSLSLPLPLVDLQHLSAVEREAEILRLATEEARLPFDVSLSPLVRTTLLRLGREDYLLLLSMHSIISDEWSIGLFCQELAVLYEAFLSGRPSPLDPLPMQYTDYTLWQEEWLQEDMLADSLAYWKKQLEHAPTVLTLPTDHLRQPVQTYRGAVQPFALSKHLTDNLTALSRQEGVSLYTTLAAAFQTLLHRYTGQDDLLIGSPVAGRTRSETENLIGSLSNTVVLRTDLSNNPTFDELLKRVHKGILRATAHQDVPFEYLVKELQLELNVAQNPLFQVMLALKPPSPVLPSGWTLTQLEVETGTSRFDLTLELEERTEGLVGRFAYSTDLFDQTTIVRMVGHWQTLLEGLVADSTQHIATLPLLTEAEQDQILVEWNPVDAKYPKDKRIHQLFEAQVERTPDAVAVVFEEKCLTYRELNRKANQLAHCLQRLGVGPEMMVGMYVERSLETVIGLLGILKAGSAYVPLDPTYPPERLAFILADTQVSVLLTQQQLVEKLPTYEGRIVCLDTDWEKIAQESAENPVSAGTAESLAYVIYTSGSTGKPKGVLVNHGGVVRLFEETQALFHFDHQDVWSLFHSYAFDFSVWELWGALLFGGRLVVVPYWVSRSPEAFYNLLRTEQVTVLSHCPAAFYQLTRVEESADTTHDLALRIVIFGCEALELPSVKPWFDRQGDQAPQLVVMYGPTETTVFVTYYPLSAADLEHPAGSMIGRAIPGSQVYLLDQYQQLVPVGTPGEIYIGGTGLARGYLHRPELTAERFLPTPFSEQPDARLYKTGDLARYRSDGNIEFLGRIDHQVKVRGFRIELGEIEGVLSQHPAVHEAVVVVREDVPGDKRLVAYIVAAQGQIPTLKNLRSSLKEQLPEYMVPSDFMLLDALPLTPNCKVDRRGLPAPDPTKRTEEETYVAPTLMVHYQLIQIWEELLDVRPIGIQDNFFDLGGQSLLATRLINRIEQVFGKKIALATLFAGPTIEQLTHALQQREDTDPRPPLVTVQTGGSKQPFFFLHGDYKQGPFYCIPLARNLGSDQPFYALQPYRLDDMLLPPTFEEMAASHIEWLRAVQPEGPYLLGGFCGGGLIAYELARQLQTQGDRVDLLVLIDPPLVTELRPLRTIVNRFGALMRLGQGEQLVCLLWLRHMYRYVQHLYRYLRFSHYRSLKIEQASERENTKGGAIAILKALHELWLNHATEDVEDTVRIEQERKQNKLGFAFPRLDAIFPDPIFPKAEVLRYDWEGLYLWASSAYMPSLYPGKSTFIFPEEKVRRHREAWRRAAEAIDKEVEVHVISGTQYGLKTNHLQDLTKYLHTCLSKVQASIKHKQ